MLFTVLKRPEILKVKVQGVELRLDCFPRIDKEEIRVLLASLNCPVILTLRKRSHGGFFEGGKEQQVLLESLLSLKPAYIDLESDTPYTFLEKIAIRYPATKIILSYHNFERTPDDLETLFSHLQSAHVFAHKIACYAHSTLDALRMLHFVREKTQQGRRIIGLCMGNEGIVSRILAPIFGNFLSFAALGEGEESAPGQLTVDQLCDLYHFKDLNPSTQLFGLIGHPIDKSISHFTHNALLRHHKIDAVYVKMDVKPEELGSFFELAKLCGFAGLSVTMPLKEAVLPFLDHIEEEARRIGAVNTIAIRKGKFFGYNTDGKGALDAIESHLSVAKKTFVLLGAGGAAKAIAFEAQKRGAELLILNRTPEKAVELASQIEGRGRELEQLSRETYHIIVNATTDPLPIDPKWLLTGILAMDIKTVPKMTPFLFHAQEKGAALVYGYEMFLHQALGQFKIWFGLDGDRDFFEAECLKRI